MAEPYKPGAAARVRLSCDIDHVEMTVSLERLEKMTPAEYHDFMHLMVHHLKKIRRDNGRG
jgi:hypothetical protein